MSTKWGLEDSALSVILNDFAENTESHFSVCFVPEGDGIWTVQIRPNDFDGLLAKAAGTSPNDVAGLAMARALITYRKVEADVEAERARFSGEDEV